MTPGTGQILRRVGLLIETLCMLGLLSIWRQQKQGIPMAKIGGVAPAKLVMAGLGVGVIVWFVGTAAIYRAKRSQQSK